MGMLVFFIEVIWDHVHLHSWANGIYIHNGALANVVHNNRPISILFHSKFQLVYNFGDDFSEFWSII
jgi:hypothetical protein